METTKRTARCTCGATAPSDSTVIAFFEDRSQPKDGECKHCGYTFPAHDQIRIAPAQRRPHMRSVPQHEFEQRTEGDEFDRFYCGHGGWD